MDGGHSSIHVYFASTVLKYKPTHISCLQSENLLDSARSNDNDKLNLNYVEVHKLGSLDLAFSVFKDLHDSVITKEPTVHVP